MYIYNLQARCFKISLEISYTFGRDTSLQSLKPLDDVIANVKRWTYLSMKLPYSGKGKLGKLCMIHLTKNHPILQ